MEQFVRNRTLRTGKQGPWPGWCGTGSCQGPLSHKHFVYITPSPVLPRLKRLHDRMLGLMKVFGRVFVLGRIAAADVTADEALSQVDPPIARLQAFLAALAARLDVANLFYVLTRCLFVRHASPRE